MDYIDHTAGVYRDTVAMTSVLSWWCSWADEEREQVERLRWPSRGYLQELSEYQQRRRQIRKSRCNIMWPLPHPLSTRRGGENKETGVTTAFGMRETRVWLLGRGGIFMYFIDLNFDLWPCDIKRMNSHWTERSPQLGMWFRALWHSYGKTPSFFVKNTVSSVWSPANMYAWLVQWTFSKMIKPQSVKQGRVNLILSRDTVDIILSRSTMVFHGEIYSFVLIGCYSCNITWTTLQVFILSPWDYHLNFMQLFL